MKRYEYDFIKVNQPIGTMYIFSADGKEIYSMAKADLLRYSSDKKDYIGIQRKLDVSRVKEITNFIDYPRATFPGSVVLSCSSEDVAIVNSKKLSFRNSDDIFKIIDGQHRLEGFRDSRCSFDIIVALYIDVNVSEEAEIFNIINSKQKSVNASFSYELEKYSTIKTPEKIVRNIAYIMTQNSDSPLYQKIKLTGYKDEYTAQDGTLSLSSFSKPIIEMIYDTNNYYKLRTELLNYKNKEKEVDDFPLKGTIDFKSVGLREGVFGRLYTMDSEEIILKLLFNFFSCMKKVLVNSWENDKSILLKTAGYAALIKMFSESIDKLWKDNLLTVNKMYEYFSALKVMDDSITSDKYGTSGEMVERKIYNDMRGCLYEK